MSKTTTESLIAINTTMLNRCSVLNKGLLTIVTWTVGEPPFARTSRIGIQGYFQDSDAPYVRLSYTLTDDFTGDKQSFNYKVPLDYTPCNFGGRRYWYICPLNKGGVYCGRRVGKLYKGGDYFGCRHCYELSYRDRNYSKRFRGLNRIFNAEDQYEKLIGSTKRYYYAGKPTRKHQRLLQLGAIQLSQSRIIVKNDL